MRQIPRPATVLIFGLLAIMPAGGAAAEPVYNLNQNQTGFTLPGVALPQGQDEVRAADGTTCRSSVSGSGAYLDLGVIQGNGNSSGDVATYGRVVVPIGRQQRRLDCSRLYQLEVERLQLELRLLKMGLGAEVPAGRAGGKDAAWAREGWSDAGQR